MKTWLLLFVISVCLAACTSNKTKQEMKIAVEMDVFSGRPNPVWALDAVETADLLKQLSSLKEVEKDKILLNDGLGYRGFIVTVTDAGAAATPSPKYRIYKGFVIMNEHIFADSYSIEKMLLAMAKAKGFGDIADTLRLSD